MAKADGKKFGPEPNLRIGADWGHAAGPPPQVDPYPDYDRFGAFVGTLSESRPPRKS